MKQTNFRTHNNLALTIAVLGVLLGSTGVRAQTIAGQATAVQAKVTGLLSSTTSALADTGTLEGPHDAREASALEGSIPALFTGNVLHAATLSWGDRVASEASVANLALTVGGNIISAAFARASALAPSGGAGMGAAQMDALLVNGLPVPFTGVPNEVVPLIGGRLIINEQLISPGQATVNALHIIVDGVADVVIASAKASF